MDSKAETQGGAYRQITKEEAERLSAKGEKVEHDEGCGWIVYDDLALQQFKAACAELQALKGAP